MACRRVPKKNQITVLNFGRPVSTPVHSQSVIPWNTPKCPYVVIEESKVFRRGCDESHIPSNLVQFSVVLCLSGMR